MTPEAVMTLLRETLVTILLVAGPLLASGLIIGVLVSIFQTVTQIREMTLTFVPKIVGVMLVMLLFGPWMMSTLLNYTYRLIQSIETVAK